MNALSPRPTVSFVIPVFKGAAFLAGAVANARAQTCPPQQIIVVDDGSTDESLLVARSLGSDVTVVAQENGGPPAARNRGLKLVQGDFVSFLDVDDLWPADKLAEQLKFFATHPAADLVLGQTRLLMESGGETPLREGAQADPSAPLHLFLIGAALFRRSVFAQIGVFDVGKRYADDLDWFLRARESRLQFHLQPRLALIKRCHPENLTRGKSIAEMGLAAVLQASLARRRKSDGVAKPLHALRPQA